MIKKFDLISFISSCLDIPCGNYWEHECNRLYCENFINSLNEKQTLDVVCFCDKVLDEYMFSYVQYGINKASFKNVDYSIIFLYIWERCNTSFSAYFMSNFEHPYEESKYNFPLIKIVNDIAKSMFKSYNPDEIIKDNPIMEFSSFGLVTVYELAIELTGCKMNGPNFTKLFSQIVELSKNCVESNLSLCDDGKNEFIFDLYLLYRWGMLTYREKESFNSIYGNEKLSKVDCFNKLTDYRDNLMCLLEINFIGEEAI